jgi:hypothetical protein
MKRILILAILSVVPASALAEGDGTDQNDPPVTTSRLGQNADPSCTFENGSRNKPSEGQSFTFDDKGEIVLKSGTGN